MTTRRRSGEEGHSRKFLVIIDDTPECSRAVLYAALRAERTGGAVVLLFVIGPADFQHWLGVENIMRAEAMEEAESTLGRFADLVRAKSTIEPQQAIRDRLWEHFVNDHMYFVGFYLRWVANADRTIDAMFRKMPWYVKLGVRYQYLPAARRRANYHGILQVVLEMPLGNM